MKKWTYLVASLLLAGTTPLLTGCVDTDEPSGIEELRGAKAELLKAKAAVEAAKVAYVQADAAYKNAEAEYKKAQAARELANAEDDRLLAEQKIKEAVAKAEEAAYKAEQEYQKLQQAYSQALIDLLSSKEEALKPYRETLTKAKEALDKAADKLTEAQRAYADALADLNESEAEKELRTRDLQFQVTLAQRNVEGYQEAVAVAKAEYEAAQTLEVADIAVKLDEHKAKILEQINTITDLQVAAAEGLYALQTTELPKVKEAMKKVEDLLYVEQALPAFSLEMKGGLPWGIQGTIDSEEAYYSLDDEYNYYNRLNDLQDILADVKSWVRDENDDAWTAERVAKMEADLAEFKKYVAKVETKWKEAVAAYNTNKADETDPTKVTGYAELKAGLESYNAAAKAWSDLNIAIYNAEKAMEAAYKAYVESKAAANKAHTDAVTAANKAYSDGFTAAPDQAKAQKEKLQKEYDAAKKAYDEASKALADYKGTDADKIKELKSALDVATIVLKNATEANVAESVIYANIITKLAKTKSDAIAAADKKLAEDIKAADAKLVADNKAQQDIIDASNKALSSAKAALDKAVAAIDADGGLYDKFNEAASGSGIAKGLVTVAADSRDKNNVAIAEQVDLATLTKLDKAALTKAIIILSNRLYGTGLFTQNAYGDFDARLKPYTEQQIKEMAEAEIAENRVFVNGYNGHIASNVIDYDVYEAVYGTFGLMGQVMIEQELININKNYIGNKEDVETLISALETAIKEIEEANEAAWENWDVEGDNMIAIMFAYVEKVDALNEPIEEAVAQIFPMVELYLEYIDAIENYLLGGLDPNTISQEAIDDYIDFCKGAITDAEDDLYKAETALMNAEKDLADYNSNEKSWVETKNRALEDAQTKYDRAAEAYQAALDALNAAIEYISSIK